jgi:nucleoredoxin
MIAAAMRADKASRREKRRRDKAGDPTDRAAKEAAEPVAAEPVAAQPTIQHVAPPACGIDPPGLVDQPDPTLDTMAARLATLRALTEQADRNASQPDPPGEGPDRRIVADPAADEATDPATDGAIDKATDSTEPAAWWGPLLQTTTLEGVDGTELDAEAVLQSADVVLLYCTASWCPPCRAFTPALVELYEEQGESRKIEVLLVSRDQPGPDGEAYRAKMPWPSLPMGGTRRSAEILSDLGIKSIPTLIGFDNKTGKCITRNGVQQAFQIFGRYA